MIIYGLSRAQGAASCVRVILETTQNKPSPPTPPAPTPGAGGVGGEGCFSVSLYIRARENETN
jgi:hypothetical protein